MSACPICLQHYRQPVRASPCGHVFCADCINQWRGRNTRNRCPCCRGKITRIDFHQQTVKNMDKRGRTGLCCVAFVLLAILLAVGWFSVDIYGYLFQYSEKQLSDYSSMLMYSPPSTWDIIASLPMLLWILFKGMFALVCGGLYWFVLWIVLSFYDYIIYPVYYSLAWISFTIVFNPISYMAHILYIYIVCSVYYSLEWISFTIIFIPISYMAHILYMYIVCPVYYSLEWISFTIVFNPISYMAHIMYMYIVCPVYFCSSFIFWAMISFILDTLHFIYDSFLTPMTDWFIPFLSGFVSFLWYSICRPSTDIILLLLYTILDGIWQISKDVFYVIYHPLMLLYNIIIILEITVCLIIYNMTKVSFSHVVLIIGLVVCFKFFR